MNRYVAAVSSCCYVRFIEWIVGLEADGRAQKVLDWRRRGGWVFPELHAYLMTSLKSSYTRLTTNVSKDFGFLPPGILFVFTRGCAGSRVPFVSAHHQAFSFLHHIVVNVMCTAFANSSFYFYFRFVLYT